MAPIIIIIIQLTKHTPVMPILVLVFSIVMIYSTKNVIDKCAYIVYNLICGYLILGYIYVRYYDYYRLIVDILMIMVMMVVIIIG